MEDKKANAAQQGDQETGGILAKEAPEENVVPLWKSASAMVGNVFFTVSIILLNKLLFNKLGLGFAPTTLMTLHQITCAIGSHLGSSSKPAAKPVPGIGVMVALIVLSGMGSNVLVNLSLKFNTVGMYQLYKMLTVPFVFLGELVFLKGSFQWSMVATLAVLLVGVALATVNDLSFSLLGTICGCIAPICAATNAIAIKHVQSKYELVGNDLLKAVTPWLVLCQLCVIPVTDDLSQLPDWLHRTGYLGVSLVILSCFIAWGLEWSYLLVVHYTSAMSMQVLGHVKTMIILSAGVALFHNPISKKGACGILIAFGAVIQYTWLKSAKAKAPDAPRSLGGADKAAAPYPSLMLLIFPVLLVFVVLEVAEINLVPCLRPGQFRRVRRSVQAYLSPRSKL